MYLYTRIRAPDNLIMVSHCLSVFVIFFRPILAQNPYVIDFQAV